MQRLRTRPNSTKIAGEPNIHCHSQTTDRSRKPAIGCTLSLTTEGPLQKQRKRNCISAAGTARPFRTNGSHADITPPPNNSRLSPLIQCRFRVAPGVAIRSRFEIRRMSKLVNCSVSSSVKPLSASRLPSNRIEHACGNRTLARSVNAMRLLRPSAGSGVRWINPSRSIRASICAMGGCSTLAKRARSRCVSARPS